ncbi:MAG: aldo/keto reductase [Firmicutes bacterium]|nr:aldo/keto reductase [Bacillota bacterium]
MKLMNSGNLLSNRTRISALLLALMLLLLTGCSSTGPAETGALTESGSAEETTLPTVTEPATKNEASEPYSTKSSLPEGTDRMFYAHVNGKVLKILAAENPSADAFLDLLKSGDVPVEMHDYGSFEKVGPLGTTLPQNDEQITTEPGDVILYQGDQITIYYDVNNWSFTRLGKVQDLSQAELKDILGSGNVTVTFSLSEGRMEPESSKVLVVIFSRTGHTKPLAEYIAEDLNADLYEIEAKVPYTDDDIKYYTNCRADREQNDPSARPEIAGGLPDVTGYDTVFIGYPIWHGQAPKIIYTFLEGVDLSGKTIIPFCTSHSSPLGTSAENLHPLAPDAAWMEGRRFAIGTTAGEISEWVKSLDILSGQPADTGVFDFEKQTVLLNSGYEMPIIGLGTWTLSDDEAENSVYHALKSGMRLIDTARYYGNEVGVGRGLQKAIDEGIVTREDVFITSKIYGGNYEHAGGIIDDALKDLNVDYIDLMLIHQPGYDDEGVYKAMEDAVRAGKLRSIGISNYYTKEQVDEVLSFATIVPAVIQNENHLYYQNTELQEYASQYGIVIESWYPFGGRGHTSEHFGNEVIKELAEKYGKSSAQIILRWQLQAGFIAIPGSSNPDHIAENYDIFDFELSKEDMQRIRELDQHERYENW